MEFDDVALNVSVVREKQLDYYIERILLLSHTEVSTAILTELVIFILELFEIKYPNNCTCLVRTHEQKLEQLLLTTLMSLPLPVFFL